MRQAWPLRVILLLAASVYIACSGSLLIGQHVDDASYVILAQALLSGQGYRMICYPEAPLERKYPPLLPLLIAACLALTHGALWAARMPALVGTLAALPVLWALLRRCGLSGTPLWLLLALIAVHPLIVGYAGLAMTEGPSLLLTWAALLMLLIAAERRRLAFEIGGGLLLGLALLLRTDAIALGAAALIFLLWQRCWRTLLLTTLLALLLWAPWLYWQIHIPPSHPQEMGYFAETLSGWWDPSPWPLRLGHGLALYCGRFIPEQTTLLFGDLARRVAQTYGAGPLVSVAQLLVGLIVLSGFVRAWARLPALVMLYVGLRLLALLLFIPQTRYLLPLLPFLLIFFAEGLAFIGQIAWRDRVDKALRPASLLAGCCLLVLLPALFRDVMLCHRPPREKYPDPVAGGALIARFTPASAIILSNWSSKSFYLYAGGRRVIEPPRRLERLSPQALIANAQQATHLLAVGPPLGTADIPAFQHLRELKLIACEPDKSLWLFAIQHTPTKESLRLKEKQGAQ